MYTLQAEVSFSYYHSPSFGFSFSKQMLAFTKNSIFHEVPTLTVSRKHLTLSATEKDFFFKILAALNPFQG